MGHIDLAVPVTHIWFLKSTISRLGLMLEMTAKSLERVIYYENYIVINPKKTLLEKKQVLTETEYFEVLEEYGPNAFEADMGGRAVKKILSELNLQEEIDLLDSQISSTRSKQIKRKASKRLRLFKGLIKNGTRPEWMVLDVIPVIPPELRPLVPLEGGRFATSDLNDLYRRVINRNNRLKNLLQLKTPDVIINNEKRMLQEAVDALFDNGRHGRPVTGSGNRVLKSLSDVLKGKQGRFRQNLLGKRVDYSGRSVIVVGPELKLHQCGLPKKMALILFEPFIIRRLQELGLVHTVRGARKMIEKRTHSVWDILEEVTKGHPVLLNRAPTLHRLSIQAFEPVLIEGNAIRLHPLVCTAYNADFDGDQMAVHVPLSLEAVLESKLMMSSTNNVFSPSSGKPILTPSQDIVLGIYYLTADPKKEVSKDEKVPFFSSEDEVEFVESMMENYNLHTWIDYPNPDFGKETKRGNAKGKIIRTTIGRVLFNEIWSRELGFINQPVSKKELGNLIMDAYNILGKEALIPLLDELKTLGFKVATRGGISIGIEDMIIPDNKGNIIKMARGKIQAIEKQYEKGIITSGERYNKIIDAWTNSTDEISESVFNEIKNNQGKDEINPVYMMMDSGARGNRQQVRQLSGTRGLMAKPSGDIIERPILSSFKEGLSVLEYFISTHGARKGLADTALKTADAGYLTRKLCDVAMDSVIVDRPIEKNDHRGIYKQAIYEGEDVILSLSERIIGRCASEEIKNPLNPSEVILKFGELITEEHAKKVDSLGIERIKIMSPLTHMEGSLVPKLSYGLDPTTGTVVGSGTAVGIIAAQSIGEPGTQLTMRTFHIGGIASQFLKTPEIRSRNSGKLVYKNLRLVETNDGANIVLNKVGSLQITNEEDKILEEYPLVAGSVLMFADQSEVKKEALLAAWDPHHVPILSEKAGIIHFNEIILGVTVKKEIDKLTGQSTVVIIDHSEDLNPQIEIRSKSGDILATYSIPMGSQIVVLDKDTIDAGSLLSKTPRQASKTQDITGGLPRVAELFEARSPKDKAEISKIDGNVSFRRYFQRQKTSFSNK